MESVSYLLHLQHLPSAEKYLRIAIYNETDRVLKAKWEGNLCTILLAQNNHLAVSEIIDRNKEQYRKSEKDWRLACNILGRLALLRYDESGNSRFLDHALEHYEDALEISDAFKSPKDYFGIQNNIVLILRRRSEHKRALSVIDDVIAKSGIIGELEVQSLAFNLKGLILFDLNRFEEARHAFLSAFTLSASLCFRDIQGKAQLNLRELFGISV
jgi:tetratricopeptide (TPR) repeat protein